MSEYLEIARKQLKVTEAEMKEMPPGDARERCRWICERIHDLIMQAEAREENGRDIARNEDNIEAAFKLF